MSGTLRDEQYRELLLLRTGLRRFLRQSESFARGAGLTPAQHQLLLAIRGHDDPAGPTIGDAASYLLLRHHSVVELVDRSAAAGLVERREDSRDARAVRLALTRSGRAALERLSERNLDELRRLADRFRPLWHGLDTASDRPAGPTVGVARIYDAPSDSGGPRVLVDRLWPRGVKKDSPSYDRWLPEVAPSAELRRWYAHRAERFGEFALRYRVELDANDGPELALLVELSGSGPLTVLTATKALERSAATVLAGTLEEWHANGARARRRGRTSKT